MESTTLHPNISLEQTDTSTKSLLLGIPLQIYVVAICSALVIIGVQWDIAWHMSIGRDGLFSAPHNAIYLGAALAGIISGYQVLKTSFWGTPEEKGKMVNFWGIFYSSLGGMFCIWGGFGAVTSAPFDDWWHATYGLDVKIFSPPHAVLGLGLIAIQIGAMISVLSVLNRKEKISYLTDLQNINRDNRLRNIFMFTAGLVVLTVGTFLTEFMGRWNMHRDSFYEIGCFAFPMFIIAFARASKIKWGATMITAIYMIVMICINVTLRQFPAEPLLAPVANHVTFFQTTAFPLLLVFPAMIIDFLRDKFTSKNDWILAVILGLGFFLTFLVIQYPAGTFLKESPLARNWFFQSDTLPYNNPVNSEWRYKYTDWATTSGVKNWAIAFLIASVLGILSARIGLLWGNWMKRVQR
jgi:hypothetical protein